MVVGEIHETSQRERSAQGSDVTINTSVVVRTFGYERLDAVLGAVFAQEERVATLTDVTIVNAGASVDVTPFVVANKSHVEIYDVSLADKDFSYGRALNVGIERARGDVVALLSGHSIPASERWLDALVLPFKDEAVAGVCGSQIPYDGSNVLETYYRRVWYHSVFARVSFVFNASNAAVRRSDWMALRFDENIASCEDRHWARSMRRRGRPIPFALDAAVYHSHICGMGESLKYFAALWGDMFALRAGLPSRLSIVPRIAKSRLIRDELRYNDSDDIGGKREPE